MVCAGGNKNAGVKWPVLRTLALALTALALSGVTANLIAIIWGVAGNLFLWVAACQALIPSRQVSRCTFNAGMVLCFVNALINVTVGVQVKTNNGCRVAKADAVQDEQDDDYINVEVICDNVNRDLTFLLVAMGAWVLAAAAMYDWSRKTTAAMTAARGTSLPTSTEVEEMDEYDTETGKPII